MTTPQVAPFSGKHTAVLNISPEGKKIILVSRYPLDGKGEPTAAVHTWIVEKNDTGWGVPRRLRSPLGGPSSLSEAGNLYFSSSRIGGLGGDDIFMSRFADGEYADPENLGDGINTELHEADPFIAPDESYVIFVRVDGSEFDLFISFRKEDGSWTKAKNMGKNINNR